MISEDLSRLDPRQHWLGWLGVDPRAALREELERCFSQQVAGSVLERLALTREPRYLTGGRRAEDPSKIVVVRAALAAPFAAVVRDPQGGLHELTGVFSWVAVGLEGDDRRDRFYLDLGDDAVLALDRLTERIYELTPDPPSGSA
jgi:hypothetical protein